MAKPEENPAVILASQPRSSEANDHSLIDGERKDCSSMWRERSSCWSHKRACCYNTHNWSSGFGTETSP